jgi:hypothetical protein
LPTLQILFRRTAVLLPQAVKRRNENLVESIFGQMEGMLTRLRAIHDQLEGKRYPFDHADETVTLQKFVIPYIPEPMDFGGLLQVTHETVERLYVLQVRLFARLAHAAEKVESVFGLPPLPAPEEKKDKPDQE